MPREERLRIVREVYRKWQEQYGDRTDSEAEAANFEMLNEALKEAEKEWAFKLASQEEHQV